MDPDPSTLPPKDSIAAYEMPSLHNDDGEEIKLVVRKLLNGIFLAACFGCVVYSILNIDHGVTRGWTQSEIAMRIPVDTWSSYESALAEKPIVTKTVINVVIYLLGDWLSQTLFQKKNILDFDISRTLGNGFIGLCFGPLVHQYYEWSDTILPLDGGIYNRLGKILMDQTLYLTVKCSIYISAVGLLAGDDWLTVRQTVKNRIAPVCFTAWKFWPLVHCLTYSVIPARHRILWVNMVDLVWNAILATQARQDETSSLDADNSLGSEEEVFSEIPSVNSILLEEGPETKFVKSFVNDILNAEEEEEKVASSATELAVNPLLALDVTAGNMTKAALASSP